MKIVNDTKLDGRRVAGVVRRAAKALQVADASVLVAVRHHRGLHACQGRFYPEVYPWFDGTRKRRPNLHGERHLIVLRVAKPDVYPVLHENGYDRKDAPPEFVCSSVWEALAAIAGHELMHLRQATRRIPASRRHLYPRGTYNEVETQWAAYRAWKDEVARNSAAAFVNTGV